MIWQEEEVLKNSGTFLRRHILMFANFFATTSQGDIEWMLCFHLVLLPPILKNKPISPGFNVIQKVLEAEW